MSILFSGGSLTRLLYNFLDEILYIFSCDPYMAIHSVSVCSFDADSSPLRMSFKCHGEEYERSKHGSKTEIKAVTFSNMRIDTDESTGLVDIYVIFDI